MVTIIAGSLSGWSPPLCSLLFVIGAAQIKGAGRILVHIALLGSCGCVEGTSCISVLHLQNRELLHFVTW